MTIETLQNFLWSGKERRSYRLLSVGISQLSDFFKWDMSHPRLPFSRWPCSVFVLTGWLLNQLELDLGGCLRWFLLILMHRKFRFSSYYICSCAKQRIDFLCTIILGNKDQHKYHPSCTRSPRMNLLSLYLYHSRVDFSLIHLCAPIWKELFLIKSSTFNFIANKYPLKIASIKLEIALQSKYSWRRDGVNILVSNLPIL